MDHLVWRPTLCGSVRSFCPNSLFRSGAVVFLLFTCRAPEAEPPLPAAGVGPLPTGSVSWLSPDRPETWDASTAPFFLFLSSRRSVWSRKMVEESFTVPQLVSEINVLTRPVWVDADLRPDLVDRFSLGALPSLAILTPERAWITGSTFLETEDMIALVRRVRILNDIPERIEDLERERRRLLKRRPHRQVKVARTLDLDGLLAALVDSIKRSALGLRSGEAQVLLTVFGYGDETEAWLDLHASERQINADGLFVTSLRSQDGLVRDELTSLGQNAGLLYTMAVVAGLTEDISLKERSLRLARAMVSQLYDEAGGGFYAGTADYVLEDSVLIARSEGTLLDRRILTAWNALAVSALCQLARFDPEHFVFAESMQTSLDRILRDAVENGGVFRTGARTNTRTLEDAAHLIRACLDYADWSGDSTYFDQAELLADQTLLSFDSTATQPDSLSGPLSGIVVGADAEFGSPAGVLAQSLYRLARGKEGALTEKAESVVRNAILTNAERLPRLGAVGRAMVFDRSVYRRSDDSF